MEGFVNFGEGSHLVLVQLERLDLAGPSSDQHEGVCVLYIVVLDLVRANRGQLLPGHRPHIDGSVCLHTRGHDVLLALPDVHASLVIFE